MTTWLARKAGALLGAVLISLSLGACATPYLALPGPAIAPPVLEGNAYRTADAAVLPLQSWLPDGPPRAVIVALHGFNDYSNAFAEAGAFWAKQGIAVYAYDQRGFGEAPHRGLWPGAQALAEDAVQVVELAAARHPSAKIVLLGESMGGAVAMMALAGTTPPTIDGLILSAPAVWGRSHMTVFERAGLWFLSRTFPGMTLTGRGLDIQPSDNIEMLRALSRDPLVIKETRVDAIHGLVDLMDAAQGAAPRIAVPVLVLYGEKDEIVPAEPTFDMVRTLPRNGAQAPEIALYPQGYHMLLRDLQAEIVLKDIAAWIVDPQAPLPSGADRRADEVLAEK